jgi:hypothetical protein
MAIDFKAFDEKVNLDELKEGVAAAANGNTGERVEVPLGNYDVSIEKLELVVSKKGDPMVTCWMKNRLPPESSTVFGSRSSSAAMAAAASSSPGIRGA